jgi:MoaA/NifB/PqqE/SkfB family radical SAM enzyme
MIVPIAVGLVVTESCGLQCRRCSNGIDRTTWIYLKYSKS